MEIIHVKMSPHPEQTEKFLENLQIIVEEGRLLEGCLLFEWYHVPDEIDAFILYGEYKDEKSYMVYKKSNVLAKINRILFPLLSAEPVFKQFRGEIIISHNVK